MVTLFCAIVSVTGSVFAIDIDSSKAVNHLKDAKKYQFAAAELQLLLVKIDATIDLWRFKKVSTTSASRQVPVNDRLSQIASTMDITGELSSIWKTIFKPETRDTFSDITTGIVRSVIDPLVSGLEFAPESMFHHLWDSLIAMLLRSVSDGNFHHNRNISNIAAPYRPKLCFYYPDSNVCVFRGDEK
ncbi:Serine/threonine protein kinase [Phytophthora megakarya]|uniref:Serine/threonine protein kinase n=1 Tax=Phytophthora megakarya TaxID=4795 RepID=A0A225UVF7_9STRA|nr:Serine/threonine protein kinase [Phytophthora megakarya]